MIQGAMQVQNSADANTTTPSDRLPIFARWYQAHRPAAGRNASSDVPFSAIRPQSAPNSIHGSQPSRSSRVSASQITVAKSSADRLVSQITRVHQKITFGSRAHAHDDPMATFSEKMRRAIRKIGTHVSAEKMLLIVSNTNAEIFE